MKSFVFAMLAILIGANAQALTLAEKKKLADAKTELETKRHAETFKKKCGYDLPITVDDQMIVPFLAANTSVSSYCDEPRSVLASMCEDATSKTEITAKIKKITCKAAAQGEMTLKLSGGTLEMAVGPGTANQGDKCKKWFEANL